MALNKKCGWSCSDIASGSSSSSSCVDSAICVSIVVVLAVPAVFAVFLWRDGFITITDNITQCCHEIQC